MDANLHEGNISRSALQSYEVRFCCWFFFFYIIFVLFWFQALFFSCRWSEIKEEKKFEKGKKIMKTFLSWIFFYMLFHSFFLVVMVVVRLFSPVFVYYKFKFIETLSKMSYIAGISFNEIQFHCVICKWLHSSVVISPHSFYSLLLLYIWFREWMKNMEFVYASQTKLGWTDQKKSLNFFVKFFCQIFSLNFFVKSFWPFFQNPQYGRMEVHHINQIQTIPFLKHLSHPIYRSCCLIISTQIS